MATCFLFAQQMDEENCLSLRLGQNGQVDAPLALRSIAEIKSLQINANTVVVISTDNCSLHEVELPLLHERKARAALPYALEEQLAQNVSTLHFAFARSHYQNNRYLVAVIDKQIMIELIDKLEQANLNFDVMTLDWFALELNEACITSTNLIVNDLEFKGSLGTELADFYLNTPSRTAEVFLFKDSLPFLRPSQPVTEVKEISYVWMAQRLLNANLLNLCQGELQRSSSKYTSRHWYQISAGLFGLWLVSLLIVNAINLFSVTRKTTELDQQIAVIYHQFFPQAQQVISPKFRISQLLKSDLASAGGGLWTLLDKLAHSFDASQLTIQQLRFQNQILSVTLTSKDFAALEKLELSLQHAQVKVAQTQASSHEQQVVATLELSL